MAVLLTFPLMDIVPPLHPLTEKDHLTELEQTKMGTEFQKQGHPRVEVALDLDSEALWVSALLLAPRCPLESTGVLCYPLKGVSVLASGYV